MFRSFSTGSKFLSRDPNDEEKESSEISQEARKNSLSMSDIGSSGEDSMTFVEDKINDPPNEEERDETVDIIYEDGVTQLEDSIGRLRQLLEARREAEGQGFTRSMSDPAKALTSLEYDGRVLRTFSVKKPDPVSASVHSDCAEDAFKSKEDRFANFIRFVRSEKKVLNRSFTFTMFVIGMRHDLCFFRRKRKEEFSLTTNLNSKSETRDF